MVITDLIDFMTSSHGMCVKYVWVYSIFRLLFGQPHSDSFVVQCLDWPYPAG